MIAAEPELIWDKITNVNIEEFSDPIIFQLLDIPKPLRADIVSEGKGGKRIAYFDSGKQFNQEILKWNPYQEYSFSFNPEKGFKVGYVLDIADGVFRIKTGSYTLIKDNDAPVRLILQTDFSINRYLFPLFILPARLILLVFQNYLLRSIKQNAE